MILQKCVTFWDYKREREKMKITKEDVLKIEHEIIDEDDDIWSMSDELRQQLIFYYHGAHYMANKIIKKLEGKEG